MLSVVILIIVVVVGISVLTYMAWSYGMFGGNLVGDTCVEDKDCRYHKCKEGDDKCVKCRGSLCKLTKIKEGKSCGLNEICDLGLECINGKCAEEVVEEVVEDDEDVVPSPDDSSLVKNPVGSSCASVDECESGFCENDICVETPTEEPPVEEPSVEETPAGPEPLDNFVATNMRYVKGKGEGLPSCIATTTLEDCKDKCERHPRCKSFDFGIKEGNKPGKCCLNNDIQPMVETDNFVNYRSLVPKFNSPCSSSNPCGRMLICKNNICKQNVATDCDKNSDCASNNCSRPSMRCAQTPLPALKTGYSGNCSTTANCNRGLTCSGGKCLKARGFACVRPYECASGTCSGRKCT